MEDFCLLGSSFPFFATGVVFRHESPFSSADLFIGFSLASVEKDLFFIFNARPSRFS